MPMMEELGLVLLIVASIGLVLKKAKIPLIIGYMLTGLLAGPYLLDTLHSNQILNLFSTLGISTLLFTIGLHLSPRAIKDLGRQALILGLAQVLITSLAGSGLLLLLGFDLFSAIFLAIALSFSSTIVVLKLLSDRNEIHQLHGRLAIGLLLIQDLIVSIVLLVLAAMSAKTGVGIASSLIFLFVKSLLIVIALIIVYKLLIQKILPSIARESELLFVTSMAWGLGIAVLFEYLNLSLEIGALVAGVILANSIYAEEMASRLRPLRDFFLLIFFVELGANLDLVAFQHLIIPVITISLFVMLWKPIIIMGILKKLGFHQKVSFKTGVSMTQISEFSLIMGTIGLKAGLIDQNSNQLLGLVGLITITLSTYAISRLNQVYNKFSNYLELLSPNKITSMSARNKKHPDVLVFGYNLVGKNFIHGIRRQNFDVRVIDFNPDVIEELKAEEIPYHFGDAGDSEFLSNLPIEKIKLIISTIPDLESNLVLVSHLSKRAKQVASIFFSRNQRDANILYERGANLVIIPHHLAANRIIYWLSKYGVDPEALMSKRKLKN